MNPVQEERDTVRRDMIDLLKRRLADGDIKSMDMRLLDDLLKQEAEAPPVGTPMPELMEDLPYEGDNLVVGNFNDQKEK